MSKIRSCQNLKPVAVRVRSRQVPLLRAELQLPQVTNGRQSTVFAAGTSSLRSSANDIAFQRGIAQRRSLTHSPQFKLPLGINPAACRSISLHPSLPPSPETFATRSPSSTISVRDVSEGESETARPARETVNGQNNGAPGRTELARLLHRYFTCRCRTEGDRTIYRQRRTLSASV